MSSVNINKNLCKTNIKYSNFVNAFSINSACESLLQTKYITSIKDKKILNKYKMNNNINTNFNNFVTIDNNYNSQTINNSRLVRYDGVLNSNKHKFTTSVSYSTPSILPRMDFNIYSSNILTCTTLRNSLSNPLIHGSSINVITVLITAPSNFWRKKAINKYEPTIYDDFDKDLYGSKSFVKACNKVILVSSYGMFSRISMVLIWRDNFIFYFLVHIFVHGSM